MVIRPINYCWLGWSHWLTCDKCDGHTVVSGAGRPTGFWQTVESLESCDCFVHSFVELLLYLWRVP